LFSDIDGLYTADPKKDKTATLIPFVSELTDEIEASAGQAGSAVGTGGMVTKLMAARICMDAGCAMAIASGLALHPLTQMEKTGRCTWFLSSSTPVSARKAWIAGSIKPKGVLTLDKGAVKALSQGKSLLPAGVLAVSGDFERGDAVLLQDENGRRLGKGLTAYNIRDARLIIGKHSADFESLLGYHGQDEIVHRDDLAAEK